MTYCEPELLDGIERAISKWYRCPICYFADGEPLPDEGGNKCKVCSFTSDYVVYLFHYNANAIVNLIHDAAFGDLRAYGEPTDRMHEPSAVHITILLFFCTLREICVNELIRDIARARNIPQKVIERLEADNKSNSQKLLKLFPSLTGIKWKDALVSLSDIGSSNYAELDERMRNAGALRNKFMHEGNDWTIDGYISNQCITDIPEMLQLFALLNNQYVHPHRRNI